MSQYLFPIVLSGDGRTPQEAWDDATESFMLEPGPTPEDYRLIEEDEEDDYHVCDRCGALTDTIEALDGEICGECGGRFCTDCIDWDAVIKGRTLCIDCADEKGE